MNGKPNEPKRPGSSIDRQLISSTIMVHSEAIAKLNDLIKSGPPSRAAFQRFVWAYFNKHGRSFPWRKTKRPYAILVSEVMLQQTQTDRVIPKYREFLRRFPTIKVLSQADKADVIDAWIGLGYYRRALNLQRTAQRVCAEHNGRMPRLVATLRTLPGVGAYTAAAVAAFAFNEPAPMVETNIRAVYLHVFFPEKVSVGDDRIAAKVEETLDRSNPREWFYALMDLGAELKREMREIHHRSKHNKKQSRFKGSFRQVRAAVLKAVAQSRDMTARQLLKELPFGSAKIERAIESLALEGFITKAPRGRLRISR